MTFDRFFELIAIQFLPTLGFILALLLLAHLLKSKRSPAATFAWLFAIIFIPYLAVPCYLFFGGRKMKRMTRQKKDLIEEEHVRASHKDQNLHDADEIFPIREGNTIECLSLGTDAFEATMKLLQSAKQSIYITTYIFEAKGSGKTILDLLTQKAKDGLEVCLLLDAVGCMRLNRRHLDEFKQAGGQVSFFMPMMQLPFRGRANLRNHRKILLVDRESAIVGGRNLADEYLGPETSLRRWRDLSLLVKGPMTEDLFDVFYSDWKFASGKELQVAQMQQRTDQDPGDVPVQVMPSGPDASVDYLQEAIVQSLFEAKERFWIVTPYFVPGEMLMRSLSMASRRGVDVRIYIPKKSNHGLADFVSRTYLRELQKAGVSIFQYTQTMLHAKLVVVDRDLAITGSANMDMRSLFLNYEIAFLIRSQKETKLFSNWVEDLMPHCQKGDYSTSTVQDVVEGVGRLLAPLV